LHRAGRGADGVVEIGEPAGVGRRRVLGSSYCAVVGRHARDANVVQLKESGIVAKSEPDGGNGAGCRFCEGVLPVTKTGQITLVRDYLAGPGSLKLIGCAAV